MKAYRGYGAPNRDEHNDLDCPQCGGWFPSFTVLADHVTRIHSTHVNTKESDMNLPSSDNGRRKENKSKSSGGKIPGSSREPSNDYNAFLKPGDIGKLGSTARVMLTGEARTTSGTYGDQIVAEVKLGRVLYDWSFKLNSPNHREIEEQVGLNPAKWKKKTITLAVKEHMDREYIAVVGVRQQKANKATARKAKTKKAVKRKVAR